MTVLLLAVAIVATATISGTFGLGGGMILMGVYAAFFSVPQAMVLHGITQLSANLSRVYFLRAHLELRLLPPFIAGIGAALALAYFVSATIDKVTLYFALGALPLVELVGARLTKLRLPIDVTRRPHAFVGATLIASLSLLVGASGPILDMLFNRSRLDRFAIVATKSLIACVIHGVKILFWTLLAAETASLPSSPWLIAAAILLPPFGSKLGKSILSRLKESGFRRYSQALIVVIGCVYLARAINLAFSS